MMISPTNNNVVVVIPSMSSSSTSTTVNNNNNNNNSNNHDQLRQEICQLQSQLKKVSCDKYKLEQAFRCIQDRVRADVEASLYLQAQGYEARLVELHSVIGELKRQIVEKEAGRIREEEEGEDDESDGDDGQSYKDNVLEIREETDPKTPNPKCRPAAPIPIIKATSGPSSADLANFQKELHLIRVEHLSIKKKLQEKEVQFNASQATVRGLTKEKNFMQDKITQLEKCLKIRGMDVSKLSQNEPKDQEFTKIAKTVQLSSTRTANMDPIMFPITGQDISASMGLGSGSKSSSIPQRVLTDSIKLDAQLAELGNGNRPDSECVQNYQLEIERLHYALENQLAQNEILMLNLEDGKEYAESQTLLLGKYESRFVTMEMLLGFGSQIIESYDVLVALLESELGQLLANCRAVGIGSNESCCSSGIGSSGSPTRESSNDELVEVANILQRANENRLVAECAAKGLLGRMVDGDLEGEVRVDLFENPLTSPDEHGGGRRDKSELDSCVWEDTLSSTKSTRADSSTFNYYTSQSSLFPSQSTHLTQNFPTSSFEKITESRVRSLIIQLKTRSESLQATLDNSSQLNWNLEEPKPVRADNIENRRNDLEVAILMQELMGLKEERAELRGEICHLSRERSRLEENLERFKTREAGYRTQIKYLEAGTKEHKDLSPASQDNMNNNNISNGSGNSSLELRNLHYTIKQLNETLFNCERDHELQSTQLSHSNKLLIDNLNSTKCRYEKRIKKMEEQIVGILERYASQIRDYKDKVWCLQQKDGRK